MLHLSLWTSLPRPVKWGWGCIEKLLVCPLGVPKGKVVSAEEKKVSRSRGTETTKQSEKASWKRWHLQWALTDEDLDQDGQGRENRS